MLDDILLAWVLIFPANHNPVVFSVPSGTEKVNKSAQVRLRVKITPTCCTCLTVILML